MKTSEQDVGKAWILTSSSGGGGAGGGCLIGGRERVQIHIQWRETKQKQIIINKMKLHGKTAEDKKNNNQKNG